jgi:hypothetical protein
MFCENINLDKSFTNYTNVTCLQETYLIDIKYRQNWQPRYVVANGTTAFRKMIFLAERKQFFSCTMALTLQAVFVDVMHKRLQ